MAMDLLAVEPHVVKPGVQGKMFMFVGGPKTGKTSMAAKFSKPLLLAYESGYNLIDGVPVVPIETWTDTKNYAKQLRKPEVREKYDTIIIDTVTIMWSVCEKFILTQKGAEDLGDIGYGKGYRACRKEFESVVLSLGQMGYTLIFITHAEKKDYTDILGRERSGITPLLDKRPKEIITGLVDVMLFIAQQQDEQGNNHPVAFLRGGVYGDVEIEAGNRYPPEANIPAQIPFTYEDLERTIIQADETMKSLGVKFSDKSKTAVEVLGDISKPKKRSFSDAYKEAQVILDGLKTRIENGETNLQDQIIETIESNLGAGKKLAEATPAQLELVEATIEGLKEL